MANNNYREPSTRKRGRPINKLSVRLFLLDPDNHITKVTKETCSKEGIKLLMQKGYGPPQPEHCLRDDKVEFLLELTNEQFKQKLVEIYPKLENACFVFMRADKNNQLEELNPGRCCFRCYTPENVYNSERGQGRLYIRKIAENEISQCTHGISRSKRLCGMVGGSQQLYIPILPKPVPALSTSIGVVTSVAMPTNRELPVLGAMPTLQTESSQLFQNAVNMLTQSQLSSSTITSVRPPDNGSENLTTQGPLPASAVVSQTGSTPTLQSSGSMVVQSQLPTSAVVYQTGSSQPVHSSVNMVPERQLPSSAVVSQTALSPPLQRFVNMVPRRQFPSSAVVSQTGSSQPVQSLGNIVTQSQLPISTFVSQIAPNQPVFNSGNMLRQGQLPIASSLVAGNTSMSPFQSSGNMVRQGQSQTFVSGSMTQQGQFSRLTGVPDANFEQRILGTPSQITSLSPAPFSAVEQDLGPQLRAILETMVGSGLQDPNMVSNSIVTPSSIPSSGFLASERWVQSAGLDTLADVIMQREQSAEWLTSNGTSSNVQGNLNLLEPNELRIDKFLENVESTEKLEISLAVLNNEALLKKLKESKINIHAVEIQSTCEVHKVLSDYSLLSCLKVLRINDNTLNYEDIFALVKSLSGVNSLQELDLSRTKFKESSFISFVSVLINCSNLTKLSLTDNGLTKQDVTCLTTALCSIKCLKSLNLSKSNLTDKQANDILQIHGEAKNIVSLDLSQNALQGNEIIIKICQLQSLEELNLSHNKIRFFPLPNLEEHCDSLPINTKTISLSFNQMTPNDISQFCSLVRSDLLKLILDSNHVGSSVWSLCSLGLRIKHLKVLSLVNTDVCGAVDGLAFLLSLVGELEELNLSSNNLVLKDFQQIQSPLSNLSQLKGLNLSNNPEGISALLAEILPSLNYLEKLSLSNIHLNGDDISKICDSLASLKGLKYLDISMNAIGPVGTRALANILKELSLLEGLDVSRSSMTEGEINVLCNGLVLVKELKYLNFSGNRIDIEVLVDGLFLRPTLEELIISDIIHGQKLFVKIVPLKNLRKLHLTNLKLRACDLEALATMLSSFPKLKELSLANIVVPNFKCEKIFRAIKLLRNIKNINLSGIKLLDGNALADMLSSLLSLEELVLADMNVANMDYEKFFSAIDLLKSLRKLDLRGVKMLDGKALFDMLSSLTLLEEIIFPDVALVNADCINFSALKSLRYLKNLDLHETRICVAENLTRVLPSLQLMEKLVLGEIEFDEESEKQLITAVGNLRYLKELDLERTCITKTGAEALAEVLPSLQLLEKLVLRFKNIDCVDECSEKQLFAALGKLRYLKELSCVGICITDTGAEALAESLPSLQLLEKLVFKWIDFDNESVKKQLFAALGKLRYLKELSFVLTCITDTGAEALAESLPLLQLLEKLVFEKIVFDNESVEKQLFAALGKLRYLKELSVVRTNITDTGAEALAESLPSLQLLEKLRFGNIDFDNESVVKQLFAALGKLRYLKELKLDISETGAEALAEMLPSLQLLEKLTLRGIHFKNVSDRQLFNAVGSLSCLKELDILFTTITQTGAEILTAVLPTLHNLKLLWLPEIESDENEALITKLEKETRLISGLEVLRS